MATTPIRREYIRHNQRHVAYLKQYYLLYTIDEIAEQLQLPAPKLKALARRCGIRKRALNKQKTLISATSIAVA